MLKRSGFTLIELLVVVSIIAILSAIGLVTFSSVLKQGRDSKRQSDLRSIQSALEQYYADQFFYPLGVPFGSTLNNLVGRPRPSLPPPLRIYLNSVPTESFTSSSPYCYEALPTSCNNLTLNCSRYYLYAKLENPPSGATSYTCRNRSGVTYNLRVTPP